MCSPCAPCRAPPPQDPTSGACARARLAACRGRDAACAGLSLGPDASPLQVAYIEALSGLGNSSCGPEGFTVGLLFEGVPLPDLRGAYGNASARAVAWLLESVPSAARWYAARVPGAPARGAGRRRALLQGGAREPLALLLVSVPVADRAGAVATMSKAAGDYGQGIYAALRLGSVPFRPLAVISDGTLLEQDAPLPVWATRTRAGLDALPAGAGAPAKKPVAAAAGASAAAGSAPGWLSGLSREALVGLIAGASVLAVATLALGCTGCFVAQRRAERAARGRRTPRAPRFSDTAILLPPSDLDASSLEEALAAGTGATGPGKGFKDRVYGETLRSK
jgi:hypothetical protein